MKVRTGFVSNSSSTSYVLIMTKADYDAVLEKLPPLTRSLSDQLSKELTLSGTPIVVTQWMSGNEDSFEWLTIDQELVKSYPSAEGEDSGDDSGETVWHCWKQFEKSAKENGGVMTSESL